MEGRDPIASRAVSSFSDEELDSVFDYSDLFEGDISSEEERPEQVAFYQPGKISPCGHRNKEGLICERLRSHSGYHMLRPGVFPKQKIQIWDESGQQVVQDYGLLAEDPDPVSTVSFPEDSDGWCGHANNEGWACERFPDHDGPHMLRPLRWPDAPCQSWDDDGNCVDAMQASSELLGDEAAEAIQRGIELLDETWGSSDWMNEVDLDSLNENSQENSLLGQLYGRHHDGMKTLFLGKRSETLKHGLVSDNEGPKFTALWREALYERKMQGALERVRRGHDLLDDKLGPGWVDKIDLDRLDESDGERCTLAFAYDENPDAGIAILFEDDWEAAGAYGFYDQSEEYALMTEAWKRVFAERRGS